MNKTILRTVSGPARFAGVLMLVFIFQTVAAKDVLWFSNIPPESSKKVRFSGMHRLASIGGRRGAKVIQWLRMGDDVEHARYVAPGRNDDYAFYFFSPQQTPDTAKFVTRGKSAFFTFANKKEGYYNAYLVVKKLSGDTLYVSVAKDELLNHSCRNGHKNVRRHIGPWTYPEYVTFELVRERTLKENFHYFASSGDILRYQLILDGKPLRNASVTMVTQTGWKKMLKTGENGYVEFQLIQDYFSPWKELNRRKIYYYLIYGEITVPQQGEYMGKPYSYVHYTTSMSDGYRPARSMYQSMFWAFVVFILTVFVSVIFVFVYRLKRSRVYKEDMLDEKDY